MIPGLKAIPAFNGAGSTGTGSGGSKSFTLLDYATSTGSSVSIPGGAIEGDWGILFDFGRNFSGGSISSSVPTNWTQIATGFVASGSASIRLTVSQRILPSGAAGSSVSGINTTNDAKVLMVFRPSSSILTVVPSTWNNEVTAGNPASQGVTASGVTTPLIVFGVAAADDFSTLPSFSAETPSFTAKIASGDGSAHILVGYTIYNTSPSNHTVDMNDISRNGLMSGYVRFT